MIKGNENQENYKNTQHIILPCNVNVLKSKDELKGQHYGQPSLRSILILPSKEDHHSPPRRTWYSDQGYPHKIIESSSNISLMTNSNAMLISSTAYIQD